MMMVKPFILAQWLKIGDIESNPYIGEQGSVWNEADDRRLLLLALDRYAAYIRAWGLYGR